MRRALVADLTRLVAFETVSHRPVTALAAWVAQRLEDLGFAVARVPEPGDDGKTNLIATVGPPGTDGLTLSGHMDVVPVDGQPWTQDPFVVTERDGHLYGRGTADMLGFLAAVLQALPQLPLRRLRRQLVLVWTHDEEVGCVGSGHLSRALADAPPDWPRSCLIGEPTGFSVLRMHPGHVKVHLEITGEAAHSSRPHLGRNAIETAARVVLALRELADGLAREVHPELPLETPWVTFNTGRIHGGAAVNIVPDACRVDVGYRPLPGMDPLAVFHRIQALLAAQFADDVCGVHAHVGTVTPAMLTPTGTALAALLAPHARPGPEAAPFATDGGNLAHLGLAPLIFGPGSIDVAHKADEHVALDELARTVDVVRDLIAARCL